MAVPTTRKEFKEWCLRKIGWPVIKINLSDEQIDDRIDEALRFYQDFHMDGSDKLYYKYQMYANNRPDSIHHLNIVSGGTLYSNADTLTFTGSGDGAEIGVITNGNGTIVDFTYDNNGRNFASAPSVTINTSTGTGASLTAELGGYVQLPNNIIGVVNLFDVGSTQSSSTDHMFNVRYQIALNELWTLTNVELAPYYMAMHHLRVIEEVLVGKQPIRYNRNHNRLYLDMNYDILGSGQFIIIEAFQVVEPDKYPLIWSDKWLQRYAAALIKLNWSEGMSKFGAMPMPGGMTFNFQNIKEESREEVEQLEEELRNTYSLPTQFYIN